MTNKKLMINAMAGVKQNKELVQKFESRGVKILDKTPAQQAGNINIMGSIGRTKLKAI